MVLAVVGDVKADESMPVIEKYFGQLPTKPGPDERRRSNRRRTPSAVLSSTISAQPLYIEGYHRPGYLDQRRRGLRRDRRPDVEWPHLAPLSHAGAR